MAQLVDIRKVAIGPKFLTARVVIGTLCNFSFYH